MDDPELFELVIGLPPAQREQAVRAACEGDPQRARRLLEIVELAARGETSVLGDADEPDAIDVPTHRLAQGDRVARYVIVSLLGRGASGEVYEAFDLELARRVALKLLHGDRDAAADDERRFRREGQALAKIDHPNVVRIFDVGTHEGRRWLTMELIDGSSLRPWIAGARAGSWREVLDTLIPAARGLQAAHEAGIVHRDFKPENVMLDRSGRVVVTDFGIARPFGPELSSGHDGSPNDAAGSPPADALSTASAIGTPSYMAPEQFQGRVTPCSDQYAFCRVLLEALGEERPPAEDADTASLTAPFALEPARARGPRWLRRLVARGLAVEPEDRHRDMAALVRELQRHRGRRRWVLGSIAATLVIAAVVPVLASGEVGACDGWSEAALQASLAPTWTALDLAAHAGPSPDAALAQVAAIRAASEWNLRDWSLGRTETCRQHANAMLDAATARARDRCFGAWESELRRGLQWSIEHPEALVSPRLAQELPRDPSRCLWEQPPATDEPELDAGTRDAIEDALVDAKGLRIVGEFAASEQRTRDALALADAVGSQRDRADILQRLGALAARNHDWKTALELLHRALELAETLGADHTAAEIHTELAMTIALAPDRAREAEPFAAMARAKLARLGGRDAELEATLEFVDGYIAQRSGDYEAAESAYRRAAERWDALASPADYRAAAALANVARVLSKRGLHRDAIELAERALSVREAAIGAAHPLIAEDRLQLGLIYTRAAISASGPERAAGLAAATAELEHATRLARAIHGSGSLPVARALAESTNVRRISGDVDAAVAHDIAEFVEVYEKPEIRDLSRTETLYALRIARDANDALEHWSEARRLAARVVELDAANTVRADPVIRDDDLQLASYEVYLGDRDAAAQRVRANECRYLPQYADDSTYREQLAALHESLQPPTPDRRETP